MLGQFLEQNHWNIGRKSGGIRIFSKSHQLWDAVTFFLLKRFQKCQIFFKGLCLFFQFLQCYGIRARWCHPPTRINIRNFVKTPFTALSLTWISKKFRWTWKKTRPKILKTSSRKSILKKWPPTYFPNISDSHCKSQLNENQGDTLISI